MKSLGNLVRICIHFEAGGWRAGGWRHLIKLESGCKQGCRAKQSTEQQQSSDIQSSQQQQQRAGAGRRGEGDKSQGRVYEMSSVGCKRMIRDATGCNAVRRGQSRCNQMSFKDVTWLVAHNPARITTANGGWEKISLEGRQVL